ncbi:unnamed protein product [Brassica rapa]|uniref:Uncharacterized protein n=1 Tax=Brassica campestris TaxID=3711 RepID=A0A3P5Z290_BRACM|nr:unnamed protein product [Brassica rapa]VDC74022.1 unnamed protein product [Brassica rapa]
MLRRVIGNIAVRRQLQRALSSKAGGGSGKSSDVSAAEDSMLLRSLKEHYLERLPSPLEIMKGSLEGTGAVLKKSVGKEEISLFVMRFAHGGDDDGINHLFLHVGDSLCFHEAEARGFGVANYVNIGSLLIFWWFEEYELRMVVDVFYIKHKELDEKMRDVFHSFLEERGVNESLFPFLQALLYVKDHRKFAICCGGSNQLALIFSESESEEAILDESDDHDLEEEHETQAHPEAEPEVKFFGVAPNNGQGNCQDKQEKKEVNGEGEKTTGESKASKKNKQEVKNLRIK